MLDYCLQISVNVPAAAKNRHIPWQIFRHIICYISLSLSPPPTLCLLCMQVIQLLRRVISQVAIVELGWQQIVWIHLYI